MDKILENRMTGFFKARCVAFNPNEEELKELLEEAEVEIPEYNFIKKGNTRVSIIDVYLSDNNDEMFKYSIYLEDKDKKSNTSGAKLYINQIGDTQWTDSEDNLWDSFKQFQTVVNWKSSDGSVSEKYKVGSKPNEIIVTGDKEYHVCKIGEDLLVHLNKMLYDNPKKTDSFFVDMEKIFDGDFSEFEDNVAIGEPVFTAFAYADNDNKQKVFNQFVPLNMFSDMVNNSVPKYTRKVYENWHKQFDFIAIDSKYNFGKLTQFREEFVPKEKDFGDDSSDY